MGAGLGYEVTDAYYREFYSTGRISSLGTYIDGTYSAVSDDGYHYFIMAVTPSDTFYSQRSPEIEERMERDREIDSLLSSASAHYRANEDVDALSAVLEALALSLEGERGDDRYSPDYLLSRAMGYLGNITMEADDVSGRALCRISLKRDRGPFPPPVRNGKIRVDYAAIDNEGKRTAESVIAMTGSNGRFSFNVTDPYMVRNGRLTFSVYLPEDTVARIEALAPGFLDPLLSLCKERSISYEYSVSPAFDRSDMIIAVASYMLDGSVLYSAETLHAFADQLYAAGLQYDIITATGEDEEEMLSSLVSAFPDRRYFVIVYLGVSDYREALGDTYVRIDGRASLFDSETGETLATEEIAATSGGPDPETAELTAFERGARLAAGMLLKNI